jgi:hypothetical protein
MRGEGEAEGEKSGFPHVQISGTPAEAPHDAQPSPPHPVSRMTPATRFLFTSLRAGESLSTAQIAQRSVAPSNEHARSHARSPTRASGRTRTGRN